MPTVLGEDENKLPGTQQLKLALDNVSNSVPLPPAPNIIPERTAPLNVIVPAGYYVIAYKMMDDKKGPFHYAVAEHSDVERFFNDKLQFGLLTTDIKLVERASTFLEALSIADILRTEEDYGYHPHLRIMGILKARYTLTEIFAKDTKLKRYDT